MRPVAAATQQLAHVLKPTGSFDYHCDWHASHYVARWFNRCGDDESRSETATASIGA